MSNDTQPEIRFPGFTEAWEERKLGELGKTQSGIGFPDAEQGGSEGIPFFKVSDMNNIGNEYEMRNANHYVSNEQIERKKWKPIEDVPAIIFAKVGAAIMLNRKRLVTSPFLIDNNTMAYLFNNTWDIYFGKILFETINLPRYSQVGALPSYNSSDIENISVKVPVKDEQQKIGNFFKQLDDTIALHQRKLDLLKETKKGFLQKMFPKNGAKVPEIRFPGFTEDWEQRKLGEVVERVTRKNKKLESIRPLTISAQEGLIDQNEFFNKTVASRDVSGYYLVKKGEFAYNKSYSNGYPWGAVKRLNQYDMGVLSTLYIVFKPKKIDSDFLEKYYDTTYWYKEVSKHAAEGARNHGLLNIAASDFFETEIVMPLKIEEQQKIGAFFKQLDETIALQQRKLDLLKETKKGFLQKMFV